MVCRYFLCIFEVNFENILHSLQNIQASLSLFRSFVYICSKLRTYTALAAKYQSKL